MIERLSKEMDTAFDSEFDSETSQYSKSSSMFFSSKPVAARSNCSRLGNTLCLCLSIWSAQAVPERKLKARSAFDFVVKTFDCLLKFWNSLQEWLPAERQGLKLGLKLELCYLTNCWTGCKGFICSKIPESVWILNSFRSVENAEIEDSSQLTSTSDSHPPDCVGQTESSLGTVSPA